MSNNSDYDCEIFYNELQAQSYLTVLDESIDFSSNLKDPRISKSSQLNQNTTTQQISKRQNTHKFLPEKIEDLELAPQEQSTSNYQKKENQLLLSQSYERIVGRSHYYDIQSPSLFDDRAFQNSLNDSFYQSIEIAQHLDLMTTGQETKLTEQIQPHNSKTPKKNVRLEKDKSQTDNSKYRVACMVRKIKEITRKYYRRFYTKEQQFKIISPYAYATMKSSQRSKSHLLMFLNDLTLQFKNSLFHEMEKPYVFSSIKDPEVRELYRKKLKEPEITKMFKSITTETGEIDTINS